MCRDVVRASDFHGTPPDPSDDSHVALLAALLLALAFAVARMTPQVALEGVRGRAACTRRRGDATPLPRARLVDPRH
ncbi:MAG: hypothetical protein SFX73_12550 [Kofleriaceae bacterium]|nr:hypothetical protein [Kofleriaceae bacterium]